MPLQHAAAGEHGEVNIQGADRIPLPQLDGGWWEESWWWSSE